MKKQVIVFILPLFVLFCAITAAVVLWSGNADADYAGQPPDPAAALPESEEKIKTQAALQLCSQEQWVLLPLYGGTEVVSLNNNIPCITEDELRIEEYVQFSDLDYLGRCGPAKGCIGTDLLAKEPRGSIGMIRPAGWHTVKYDFIDGKYLYNRCHLIAYELCGVNADERNLLTGTRYLNIDGMLPIENQVFSYISSTGNHVFYRVTPHYSADNLLASGVQIEAYSIEDQGIGIALNVFCFNVQPGVIIDYPTGDSWAEETGITRTGSVGDEDAPAVFVPSEGTTYILNINTHRFHLIDCQSVQEMKDKNRVEFSGGREELIEEGYLPCGRCKP